MLDRLNDFKDLLRGIVDLTVWTVVAATKGWYLLFNGKIPIWGCYEIQILI
jgi:hypothetical protein